jgi:hypothetical protein
MLKNEKESIIAEILEFLNPKRIPSTTLCE